MSADLCTARAWDIKPARTCPICKSRDGDGCRGTSMSREAVLEAAINAALSTPGMPSWIAEPLTVALDAERVPA
jgi:hypothetical protein